MDRQLVHRRTLVASVVALVLACAALAAALLLAGAQAVAAPPAGDDYPGTEIGSLPFTDTGSTVEATGEVGEPDPGGGLRAGCPDATSPDSGCLRSVWFSLPPGGGEWVTAETCESDFDTVLAAYGTANPAPTLSGLPGPFSNDENDNTCEDNPSASSLTFQSFDPVWERISINGFEADSGDYVLHVYDGPDTSISVTENSAGEAGNPVTLQVWGSAPGTVECSLDGAGFEPCGSLLTPAGAGLYSLTVAPGPHVLAARATDANNNTDPYPATAHWTTPGPPPPAGGPAVTHPQNPPQAKLGFASQRLGGALRRGLRVKVQAGVAGSVSGLALLNGAVARRFGLSRGRVALIGSGSATLAAPGTVTLVLKFTRKARRKLRRAKRVPLTVSVTVSAATARRRPARRRSTCGAEPAAQFPRTLLGVPASLGFCFAWKAAALRYRLVATAARRKRKRVAVPLPRPIAAG